MVSQPHHHSPELVQICLFVNDGDFAKDRTTVDNRTAPINGVCPDSCCAVFNSALCRTNAFTTAACPEQQEVAKPQSGFKNVNQPFEVPKTP